MILPRRALRVERDFSTLRVVHRQGTGIDGVDAGTVDWRAPVVKAAKNHKMLYSALNGPRSVKIVYEDVIRIAMVGRAASLNPRPPNGKGSIK